MAQVQEVEGCVVDLFKMQKFVSQFLIDSLEILVLEKGKDELEIELELVMLFTVLLKMNSRTIDVFVVKSACCVHRNSS